MTDLVLVYVTCPDLETARRIGRALVEEKLVACANLHAVDSIYRREGRLVEEGEVLLLMKTRRAYATQVIEAVVERHPYDVPCVVAYPASHAHAPYAAWVEDATSRNA